MDVVRQVATVTAVLLLACLALWLVRRKGSHGAFSVGRNSRRGPLESRGRLALSPEHTVHIVAAGDREMILGVHPAGIVLLGEMQPGAGTRTGGCS